MMNSIEITPPEHELVASGMNVFQTSDPVVGTTVWLESPKDVLNFVASGEVSGKIVIVRGGTTTFLSPALSAGIAGIITLQGAPESHLGILSREFGVPCAMSVVFERGLRTDRGEVIPPDGTPIQMSLADEKEATIFAPLGELLEPSADGGVAGLSAAERDELARLLANFQGEVPPGTEGSAVMESRMDSSVLTLEEESLKRDLSPTEVRDMQRYLAWAEWDALAARATEGESGLIPRQEYEALGFLNAWYKLGPIVQAISDRLGGADGVIELGKRARTEIGTKINLLHSFALATAPEFGRGIAIDLGQANREDDASDVEIFQQFTRRLYRGHWDDNGPIFSAQRGYRAPLLDQAVLDELGKHRVDLADSDALRAFQLFNGTTELLGFLIHFDNRCGLGDSGPYPTSDGGFAIVRDHILNETAYHWSDVADGLPYAVTQVMYFPPNTPLEVQVVDLGTTFTKPANYLQFLSGVAVFARDEWDTPMSEIRALSVDDMSNLQKRSSQSADRLYRRIAAMSRRDKLMAGAMVYTADFILPYARAAGMWDEVVNEMDLMELDPRASTAYYKLIDGHAVEMMPRLFLTGNWTNQAVNLDRLEDSSPANFSALHTLAVRGLVEDGDYDDEVQSGLAESVGSGVVLSEQGRVAHAKLLRQYRDEIDIESLKRVYRQFLNVNREFKKLASQWRSDGADAEFQVVLFAELVGRFNGLIAKAADVDVRFSNYADRIGQAWGRVEAGDLDFVVNPRVPSVHNIWMECHEDLIQVLEVDREAEGSF